jgi:hypothetical protein
MKTRLDFVIYPLESRENLRSVRARRQSARDVFLGVIRRELYGSSAVVSTSNVCSAVKLSVAGPKPSGLR